MCSGDAEDDPDGGRLDNRAERFVVDDAVPLREPTNDPSGFMSSQRAVSVILVLEDPLAGDDVDARRSRNETPGAIVHEHLVFFSHGRAPICIGECGTCVAWQRRSQAGGRRGEAIPLHGRWQGTRLGTNRPHRRLWSQRRCWGRRRHCLWCWSRRSLRRRRWSRSRLTTTVVDAEPVPDRAGWRRRRWSRNLPRLLVRSRGDGACWWRWC